MVCVISPANRSAARGLSRLGVADSWRARHSSRWRRRQSTTGTTSRPRFGWSGHVPALVTAPLDLVGLRTVRELPAAQAVHIPFLAAIPRIKTPRESQVRTEPPSICKTCSPMDVGIVVRTGARSHLTCKEITAANGEDQIREQRALSAGGP